MGTRRLRGRRGRIPAVQPPREGPREPIREATVLVRPEVVRSIARAAAGEELRETGGPLLGTVQRSWEGSEGRLIVAVLATVPPGPTLVGDFASVAMGEGADGERAASALRWWRETCGLDLVHVGDWHRHLRDSPGPSGGDRRTARRMREVNPAPVWLTAVAVSARGWGGSLEATANLATSNRSWTADAEVRFYRQLLGGALVPMRIRLEATAIPRLPALPWHVADPARFAAECRLLRAARYRTAVQASAGRLGVTFRLHRDGAEPRTILTPSRYPTEPPVALHDGRWLTVPGWSSDRFLVDVMDGKR